MEQIFSNTTLTVNQLIEKIDTGELGLPELQRPFIWKDSKVRDLFDSLMRGYPIGYLMLWECPSLEKKKSIGVDLHSYDSPKEVIIDGQQRLTSLYAVMKGKKVINSKFDEKSIIISYNPLQDKFEVGYQATKKDPEWIYNISDVYTTSSSFKFINSFIKRLSEYRECKGGVLTEAEQDTISENINAIVNLKNHTLPVFDIKANAEEEDVSEIFVRVNSGGVSLKQNDFILTLLSLYWDEGRKEIEEFSKESTFPTKGKTTSYNQITTVAAQDLIRVVMAYAFDRARLKYGYKLLRGADFDKRGAVDGELRIQRFDTLKDKLPDVLDVHSWHEFLKAIMNAGYLSGDLILSGNAPKDFAPFRTASVISPDFNLHDALKLYATEKGIKLQLIEEKSVNSYDPCKVMWGLSTSLYAKATGVLWHPEAIQNDTAYIGISYAFSEEKRICIGCSQLFDSTGTGIRMVLRKINNPILLGRSNPYMREDDARSMMTELREQYYHSAPVNTLRRVVIHKTTPFIREEITGIMQAFSGIEVELVQIQDYCSWRGIRFGADPGKTAYGFPVKRGMAVKLDRDSFLLWTHGCVIHPELSGPHNYYKSSRGIPAPLLVRRFAGNASGDTLAKEILMLTKMNWNSGDSLYKTLPVTLDFAKVLARMSKQEEAIFDKAYDFRFFM